MPGDSRSIRRLMAGWSRQDHGPRDTEGRNTERFGCAPGVGKRDPTSGTGAPRPSESSFAKYRKMNAEPGLCGAPMPVSFVRHYGDECVAAAPQTPLSGAGTLRIG